MKRQFFGRFSRKEWCFQVVLLLVWATIANELALSVEIFGAGIGLLTISIFAIKILNGTANDLLPFQVERKAGAELPGDKGYERSPDTPPY